jgi:trimeric autotransporter adhesin
MRRSRVYAGGDFSSIGGRRRSAIAALDARTGAATAWNPNADARVSALAVRGARVYAGGDFKSIGGKRRRGFASLDARTGTATASTPNAG